MTLPTNNRLTARPSRSWASRRPTRCRPRSRGPAPRACPLKRRWGGEGADRGSQQTMVARHARSWQLRASSSAASSAASSLLRSPIQQSTHATHTQQQHPPPHLGERPVLAPERVASAPWPTMWVDGSYLSACSYSSGTLHRGGDEMTACCWVCAMVAAWWEGTLDRLQRPTTLRHTTTFTSHPPQVVVHHHGLQANVAHLMEHLCAAN